MRCSRVGGPTQERFESLLRANNVVAKTGGEQIDGHG